MIRRPRFYRFITILATVLLGICGAIGCKKKDAAEDADSSDAVVVVQVEHPTVAPISEEIAADAILAPLSQAAIAPRVSAPIRVEYVERGSRVHKGQLLLTLEDRDLKGSALDTRGAVTSAQASLLTATQATIPEDLQRAKVDVEQAKANLEVANRTAEERKRLLQQGAIAGRDTDSSIAAAVQAQATYDTALRHLQSVQNTTEHTEAQAAQGQLTSAKGRLEAAEAQVSYATLRSPISGVVTDRPLFPGETAAAGTSVITVMDTSSLLAKLHVAQATAQQLKIGGTASLRIPGVDDAQPATVSFISPALDPGSTTVEVWLTLPNADGRYKVGTPVQALIHGRTAQNALQLPPAAILPGESGGAAVLVVGTDGTAHKRTVVVGLRTDGAVQITSGLSLADNVVTEGGYGLDDGTKVSLGRIDDKDKAGARADSEGADDSASRRKQQKSADRNDGKAEVTQ